MKNYYKIMGLSMTATESEIRSAFRALAQRFSPEVNPGNRAAAARFAEINEAYSVLSNVVLRSRYDKSILMSSEITVPLTDIPDSATTAEMQSPHTHTIHAERHATQEVVTEPVIERPKPSTTTRDRQAAAKSEPEKVAKPESEPTDKPEPKKETKAETEPTEKKKTLAESIAERAAAVREAYEKAAAQIAAKREAEKKEREARQSENEEKRKLALQAQKEQKEKEERARKEAAEKELIERRERQKRERAEREAIERARKEAARLKESQETRPIDVKAQMQSLMSRLGEKQTAREQAAAKAQKAADTREAKEEAAKPVPVEPKSVKEWAKPVEAVPTATHSARAVLERFSAFQTQAERQLSELKRMIEMQAEESRKQDAAVRALADEVRRLHTTGGAGLQAIEAEADRTSALLMAKLNETQASAEAAAATAALKAAQAKQLQEEIDAAGKRLDDALKNLDTAKREKQHLQTEMEIESAARRRAENAVEGAKQAARTYKAESERAQKRAAEEKSARMSAERAFSSEVKARKRAEELGRSDREAAVRMSREIASLKAAKEKAEARAEETRAQIARSAASEREKLERLSEQQQKNIREISAKLDDAEAEKKSLENKVAQLQTRIADQQELDREIAREMSEFEQFKSTMSEADEHRLVGDWEAKVRADIMLFKDTLYGALGVPYYAHLDEIERSAQRLLDLYTLREGDDRYDRIATVEHARDILCDPEKRAAYNRQIGLNASEISAALKAKACYEEIIRKLGREKASREFWSQFDDMARDAQTGDAAAQNKLGEAYYDGVDVPADPQQAVFWFKEAAKQLYPAALFNMGMCLLNGYGVERDEMRGRGFVKKAALVGYGPATELVDSPEFKRAISNDAYEG